MTTDPPTREPLTRDPLPRDPLPRDPLPGEPLTHEPLTLAGIGAVLPGPDGPCVDTPTLWEIVRTGTSCLTPFEHEGLPLRIAGQVRGWDPVTALGVSERVGGRMARITALATGAVKNALDDAGLKPEDLDDGRTVLVVASLQFAFQEARRYFTMYEHGGQEALGMEYWLTGTPGSVTSGICSVLGISPQTLTVSGACNCSLRALEVAATMLHAGTVDRAVVVGADATLDPICVSSTTNESKRRGFRISTLSADPASVRPHDEDQDGNAPGEGALAVVLESARAARVGSPAPRKGREELRDQPPPARGVGTVLPAERLGLWFRTSRSNGSNPMISGPPDNFSRDAHALLTGAGTGMQELAFVNSFADGSRHVEDLFCEALTGLRKLTDYDGPLLLTNQEAAFGHVFGFVGLLKFVSSVLMFRHGTVAPVVGCRTPYARLDATPVRGAGAPLKGRHALVTVAGGGGDATSLLIEYPEA
ncbi:beta-ketoacyl synthase N-terminal-like domain-containing protein [Streptomyces albicerus]|uniref:beta-ketoacyl synthase N-terminal-like domain-containing protein n=1 Tax=Streptomyces albicerus TaxID=2569859 RepID=UPI001CEC7AFF|nr:beta-ketoacyl synthase N-terminal-like domain-containing protein [Streptomyces albicerus]